MLSLTGKEQLRILWIKKTCYKVAGFSTPPSGSHRMKGCVIGLLVDVLMSLILIIISSIYIYIIKTQLL